MPEKDYKKLSLKELQAEEKKIKKQEIVSAVIIGFLIAPMIYGATQHGIGYVYIIVPLVLIIGIYKNSQKLKSKLKAIQTERKDRKTE